MSGFRSIFIGFVGILLLIDCSTRLIPKEKVLEYNEMFYERTYVLKEELKLSKDDTIGKGSLVKLYVESTPSLLKVKCYPITESREYAVGRLAIYLINDTVEKRNIELEELEEIIAQKFEPYDPNKKRKR
ncbi:type II secretion system-associated lipoprotein [Leptospira sp. GIMC2001]|uniref:type II secretion system-associated lipoprotein n=1 Tax=Leptospira sp. GIMC2001 TaxID=1513297 RepID=UPI002349E188|nr:type II secretion system-associated lipoprotein [Leptospira sp. GIMC2001]WCL47932.1 type II secretion system-associated lipoprotein [Leptospira sp. GIMC2001]